MEYKLNSTYRRSDIKATPHGVQEIHRYFLNRLMQELEVVHQATLHRRRQAEVVRGQNTGSHRLQGVVGPLQKPVDGAAIYQRRELSEAVSESVTQRRHAQHHMDVSSHAQ